MHEGSEDNPVARLMALYERASRIPNFRSVSDFICALEIDAEAAFTKMDVPILGGGSRIEIEDHRLLVPSPYGMSVEARWNSFLPDFYRSEGITIADQPGLFVRWTNDQNEVVRVADRTQAPSRNHRTGETHAGMSAARGPWYYFANCAFAYTVRGEVIADGPDGEPLVDLGSLIPVSPIVTRGYFLDAFHRRNRSQTDRLASRLDIADTQVFAFLLGVG
jgi:hypothetical protein